MKKIVSLLFVFFFSSFLSVQAQTNFLEEMEGLNKAYNRGIEHFEKSAVGKVPYQELDALNKERFGLVAGVGREIRQDGPTEDEWSAITESVWQHAACLLENDTVYDDTTGFKKVGFQTEISALFHLTTGGRNFDTLDALHRGNALALLSGLFYALELYTSHLPFDAWALSELTAYKGQAVFTSDFKTHMDDYFQTVYEELKGEAYHDSDNPKTVLCHGHLAFFLSTEESVIPHFTAVIRSYVTKGQDGQRENSPFYAARVGAKDKLQESHSNLPKIFTVEPETNFETPLKPLIVSAQTTEDFPGSRPALWLKSADFRRNELKISYNVEFYEYDKQKHYFMTSLQFTLKATEAATRFSNKVPGEYILAFLDTYMVHPETKANRYSQNIFNSIF